MKFIRKTISFSVGKGSLTHNRRDFIAQNVDSNRTQMNIEYCNENLEQVYHQMFDDALQRFNDKQKRADRKIESYYDKIRTGKQAVNLVLLPTICVEIEQLLTLSQREVTFFRLYISF